MDKNDIRRELESLSQKRGGLVTELQTLTKKPVEEKRGLSAEETVKHDKLTKEIDDIDLKIIPLKSQLRALDEAAKADEEHTEEVRSNGGKKPNVLASDEYRAAFGEYLATGNATKARELTRGLSGIVDTKGEELIPTAFWNELVGLIARKTALYGLADVRLIGSRAKFAIQTGRTVAVPRAEGGAYAENDPTFDQKPVSIFNLGALVKITEELLEDSLPDAEGFVVNDFAESFAAALELHGLFGTNGNGAYNGLVPAGLIADITGVDASGDLSYTIDDFIDLEDEIPGVSASRASYLVARKVRTALRKMKDDNGQYLWQPSLQAGAPPLFNGHPVHTSDFINNPTTDGALIAVFGDFKSASYFIRRNLTVRRLNACRLRGLQAKRPHRGAGNLRRLHQLRAGSLRKGKRGAGGRLDLRRRKPQLGVFHLQASDLGSSVTS